MHPSKWTRECTKVYLQHPGDLEEILFMKREFSFETKFSWTRFKSKKSLDVDAVEDMIKDKLKELVRKKEEASKKVDQESKTERLTWEQQINQKRRLVADCLLQQAQRNLAEVCRFTGCSYSLVKRVADDLAFDGQVSVYHYPNIKTTEQLKQLTKAISQVDGTFATITDLKRRNPGFSRKYIARQLKATGLRYLQVKKSRLKPKQPSFTDKEVLQTVSHLAYSLSNSQVETFYIDEMHFPLCQTSDKQWRDWKKADYQGHDLVYNRRLNYDSEKLSVIAMCSTEKFVAVQVFKRDIIGEDFLYFLQEALKRVPSKSRVTVLADNASWHTAKVVAESAAYKALFFNAPGLFQANLIENAFSFIRAEFRKRPDVIGDEEEARQLLNIFFDERNSKRFEGIFRNHIKSLQKLLTDHYFAIRSRLKRAQR